MKDPIQFNSDQLEAAASLAKGAQIDRIMKKVSTELQGDLAIQDATGWERPPRVQRQDLSAEGTPRLHERQPVKDPIQFNQDQLEAAASLARGAQIDRIVKKVSTELRSGIEQNQFHDAAGADRAAGYPAGIGDVNSDAKGSGARYNAGKPDLSLVPLTLLAESMLRATLASGADVGSHKFIAAQAMGFLGSFQQTHDPQWLYEMFELLGIDGWEEAAHVFTYGKRKYAAWNWAKGMPWSVPLACAARHLESMWAGVLLDNESQHPHRGHVFCNGIMLIQYGKTYPEGNDLPPVGLL